jgi:hypothetical protein
MKTKQVGNKIKFIGLTIIGLALASAVYFFNNGPNKYEAIIPDNPPSQACARIDNQQRKNNCLAIVNKDSNLCNKTAEDGVLACQAIVENKPELCAKVEPFLQKKTCIYEVARINDNIASCDFADDKKDCIGSFLAGLYWDEKFDLMDKKYCEVFPDGDKDWCLALVTQDKSVCGNNLACLSLFIQPLSFCDNQQMSKSKGECLRDRAMTQKDPNICGLIKDTGDRNQCYFNIVGHINPDISICAKISDSELKQECFSNAAVKLLIK